MEKNIMNAILWWWCSYQKRCSSQIYKNHLPICALKLFSIFFNNEVYEFKESKFQNNIYYILVTAYYECRFYYDDALIKNIRFVE